MKQQKTVEYWFVTGGQPLYGEEAIRQVQDHSRQIVAALNKSETISYTIQLKEVATTPDGITRLCADANADEQCAGLIAWMHTFSPAKMWIGGLSLLNKPLLHLHTQFNREIPWDSIDMDFMNLNQSAHGDREFGFIGARMKIPRKVVAGYWADEHVQERIGTWMETTAATIQGQSIRIARFGDNMNEVAVTEGDKVEAQIKFGWSTQGYGIGDLVEVVQGVSEQDVRQLYEEYEHQYTIDSKANKQSILEQTRIELGLKRFLEEGKFGAFTTNFDTLHGLDQLPGLAVQRLMQQGYGFGGEGDWKTAALLRLMKMMANGEQTSFMEDYTYHFEKGNELILGSHMLEVCPTISADKPKIEVHPLSIGGKSDPARMVFDSIEGEAIVASIIHLGDRFRLVMNEITAVKAEHHTPHLPVAKVLWKPKPSLETSAEAWIHAGGAHHTVLSYKIKPEQMLDWAKLVGIEAVLINNETTIANVEKELKWNDLAYKLSR
ncbi:L-arabinose isomerase [Alkalicoccobacillus murimartini]|uniref:L-arabinose isomerase n=1 Tax=Alkalicoccobacillus murimartini TaxID=171685 RepID=A0ABT9YGB9_9BACI|nr:L-arabinose isomerase [Alkalicoccobacillus murimartini]MDQ0206870.1 L-arabinose isomerase [Alkalicoccobacillus murimartini]